MNWNDFVGKTLFLNKRRATLFQFDGTVGYFRYVYTGRSVKLDLFDDCWYRRSGKKVRVERRTR